MEFSEGKRQRLRDRFPVLVQVPDRDLNDTHRDVLEEFMDDYGFRYGQHQMGHVYEWISIVNHSCNPNASAVPGFPATLKALRDIPSGEEVTITYGKEKTRFRCRCEVCEERRARYFVGIPSTDGSAGGYIRRRVRSFGKSRSSGESSSAGDEGCAAGDADDANGDEDQAGCEREDSCPTPANGPQRPARKIRGGWAGFLTFLQRGANGGEAVPRLRDKLRAFIDHSKAEMGRWFGGTT